MNEPTAAQSRTRRYPPLAMLIVALILIVFVLPSALYFPQSNPSTVLEYAPVPPSDDDPLALRKGNLSSLGLGSSGPLSVGDEPPPPPPRVQKGEGFKPTAKRCIGSPPRQTEDPMAPPCVPLFEGDNFGATYRGVTGDSITVLLYWDFALYGTETEGFEPSPPAGTYVNLDDPPKRPCAARDPLPTECDNVLVRVSRALGIYFNDRFQTYERTVHFVGYFAGAANEGIRRADAGDNWSRYGPFAVLDQATFNGHNQAYVDAMAGRDVLVFSSRYIQPNETYRKNAPLTWGFWPDAEHLAALYSTYVCKKIAGRPVRHSGNPQGSGAMNGRERRYGLYRTSDPGQPGLRLLAAEIKRRIAACGITDVVEQTFPHTGYIVDSTDPGTAQADAVAKFRAAEVTTILWPGGVEGKFTQIADAAKYYPEIVLAGDLDLDNNRNGRLQNQNVWRNARGIQFEIRVDRPEESPGNRAYRAVQPNPPKRYDAHLARNLYRDHFNLFQGIQAAGPRLTLETVDEGLHALPPRASNNPYVAAFFYEQGDYTAVKDAMEVWWDPTAQTQDPSVEGSRPGCMRMTNDGARFLAGTWPDADADAFANKSDPCTAFEGGQRYR